MAALGFICLNNEIIKMSHFEILSENIKFKNNSFGKF